MKKIQPLDWRGLDKGLSIPMLSPCHSGAIFIWETTIISIFFSLRSMCVGGDLLLSLVWGSSSTSRFKLDWTWLVDLEVPLLTVSTVELHYSSPKVGILTCLTLTSLSCCLNLTRFFLASFLPLSHLIISFPFFLPCLYCIIFIFSIFILISNPRTLKLIPLLLWRPLPSNLRA